MSFVSLITLKMILQQITVWQRKLKQSCFFVRTRTYFFDFGSQMADEAPPQGKERLVL